MLMCNQGLYNLCFCTALLVCQSAPIAEDRCYWRISTHQNLYFFLDRLPVSRHLLFLHLSSLPTSLIPAAFASLLAKIRTRGFLSSRAGCRCCTSGAGVFASGCHSGAPVTRGGLRHVCRRGNKARRPTNLTPLSSRYQSSHKRA